jgi:hypothetical protein
MWGGVIASPLIGLFIGFIYRPAYKVSKGWQVFFSLITLYVAATLFGTAMGMYVAYGHLQSPSEVILYFVRITLLGLTLSGYLLLFWPLSFLNHKLLALAQKTV